MSWLDDFFTTLRVAAAGVVKPVRFSVNFLAPFTVADNAGANSSDVGLGAIANPTVSGVSTFNGSAFGAHGGLCTVLTQLYGVETTGSSATTIATIPLSDLTLSVFDGVISGKHAAAADVWSEKICIAAVRNGGAPSLVGTLTETDNRKSGTTTGWAVSASISSNSLLIQVTGAASTNIEWTLLGQLVETAST